MIAGEQCAEHHRITIWPTSTPRCFDTLLALHAQARLAQSAERKALNLVVVRSCPTVGGLLQVDKSPSPHADARDVHLARTESVVAARTDTRTHMELQEGVSVYKTAIVSNELVGFLHHY